MKASYGYPLEEELYKYIFTSWGEVDERSLAMISTRSFCHTPTQLWGSKKKGMSAYNTGRRVFFRYIRVGSTEINANSTVKEIFGHFFFVLGRRDLGGGGWWVGWKKKIDDWGKQFNRHSHCINSFSSIHVPANNSVMVGCRSLFLKEYQRDYHL